MTTIAYDGKTLAVDSMTSCDRFVNSRGTQKMWRNVGPFNCVAMAGPTSRYPAILCWLEGGADPLLWNPEWDAVAWVVDKSGRVYRYVSGYPESIEAPDADGSGAEFALGALDAGKSAREAIEIAAQRDFYTGGPVQAFDITAAPQGQHLNAV